jgi:hypothetical protein
MTVLDTALGFLLRPPTPLLNMGKAAKNRKSNCARMCKITLGDQFRGTHDIALQDPFLHHAGDTTTPQFVRPSPSDVQNGKAKSKWMMPLVIDCNMELGSPAVFQMDGLLPG